MPYQIIFTDELYHHGVRGQKWGVRRYQNTDGSYKSGAQGRYTDDGSPGVNKSRSASSGKSSGVGKSSKVKTGSTKEAKASKSKGPKKKMSTKKKVAIGLGVAGTALAAYGAYKYSKHIKNTASAHILENGKKYANMERREADYFQNAVLGSKSHADRLHFTDQAGKATSRANQIMRDSHSQAEKTGRSFRDSYKYLKSQGVSVKPRLRR